MVSVGLGGAVMRAVEDGMTGGVGPAIGRPEDGARLGNSPARCPARSRISAALSIGAILQERLNVRKSDLIVSYSARSLVSVR